MVFLAPGSCVRMGLFQRLHNDALRLFNASTIWIMVGAWALALVLALIAGWIAKPSTSFRGALRLLATCLVMYALLVTAGLLLTHLYGSLVESDFFAWISFGQLVGSAFILLIGPSAVLLFAAWFLRAVATRRTRGIDMDSLPGEAAT